MGAALPIRGDVPGEELRRLARLEANGRVACRLIALANALDGMSRDRAAKQAGMDRQTLRDWVIRFNAEAGSMKKDWRLDRMAHAMGLASGSDIGEAIKDMNARLGLVSGLKIPDGVAGQIGLAGAVAFGSLLAVADLVGRENQCRATQKNGQHHSNGSF